MTHTSPQSKSAMPDPGVSEESIRENTGRGWTEWRELIDAMPDDQKDHPSVASWLASEHALDGWWAQAVTVGWERLSGRREKYQMADGTYRPSRTRVVRIDAAALRPALLNDQQRARLLDMDETTLISSPKSKAIRVGLPQSRVQFDLNQQSDGRTKVTVTHWDLTDRSQVEPWQSHWSAWLQSLEQVLLG